MAGQKGLVHLSYCSQALSHLNEADLEHLLATSKKNNQRDGITGLLTYSGDVFIQFIEGPQSSIEQLMGRLRGDSRHRNIVILTEGAQAQRLLPDWEMELVGNDEAHHLLREALRDTDRYDTVIALSRLLARLKPDSYRNHL